MLAVEVKTNNNDNRRVGQCESRKLHSGLKSAESERRFPHINAEWDS